MANERDFDLQDRLIEYAVRIINLCEALPNSKTGKHICSQILRSGTAAAPNHGEAQSAESRSDFVHKLKMALKELRETQELISVLYRSIETAKKNDQKKT